MNHKVKEKEKEVETTERQVENKKVREDILKLILRNHQFSGFQALVHISVNITYTYLLHGAESFLRS